jgi:hypothetical protein
MASLQCHSALACPHESGECGIQFRFYWIPAFAGMTRYVKLILGHYISILGHYISIFGRRNDEEKNVFFHYADFISVN